MYVHPSNWNAHGNFRIHIKSKHITQFNLMLPNISDTFIKLVRNEHEFWYRKFGNQRAMFHTFWHFYFELIFTSIW